MAILDWRGLPVGISMEKSEGFEVVLRMSLNASLIQKLILSLEEIFIEQERELRFYLSEAWTLFLKQRESGNRLLLAHPQTEEWVGTIALEKEIGVRWIEALKNLDQPFSLSRLGILDPVSNFDCLILKEQDKIS